MNGQQIEKLVKELIKKEVETVKEPEPYQREMIFTQRQIEHLQHKILERLENYKKHRQEWIDKQNNHQWTMKERYLGSEIYGSYQEKESLFTTKILELEWVLGLLEMKS